MKVEFIINRWSNVVDSIAFAKICATVSDSNLQEEASFFKSFSNAVKDWVDNDATGIELLLTTCFDIGVEDVAHHAHENKELQACFEKQGITDLTITIFAFDNVCRSWQYDTPLVLHLDTPNQTTC
ncbi:MAG: hypothetical protein WBB28_01555 [Crinalium sp.]